MVTGDYAMSDNTIKCRRSFIVREYCNARNGHKQVLTIYSEGIKTITDGDLNG